MGPSEMKQIGAWLDRGVQAARAGDEGALEKIAGEVRELTGRFPAPGL
jgi:glycine hydroxymethyltransferase